MRLGASFMEDQWEMGCALGMELGLFTCVHKGGGLACAADRSIGVIGEPTTISMWPRTMVYMYMYSTHVRSTEVKTQFLVVWCGLNCMSQHCRTLSSISAELFAALCWTKPGGQLAACVPQLSLQTMHRPIRFFAFVRIFSS